MKKKVTQDWLKLGPAGKPIKSQKIEGGRFAALSFLPNLSRQDLLASQVLVILAERPDYFSTAKAIDGRYFEKFGKHRTAITMYLSSFYTWGWVDRETNPADKRQLLYRLKPGININDYDNLYKIAKEKIKQLKAGK